MSEARGAGRAESLLQSQTALLGAQAAQLVLGFLLTALAVRTLSDVGFGALVYFAAWIGLAARIVDAGLGSLAVTTLAQAGPDARLWRQLLQGRTLLAIVLAAATPFVLLRAEAAGLGVAATTVATTLATLAVLALPARSFTHWLAAAGRHRLRAAMALLCQLGHVTLGALGLWLFGPDALIVLLAALAVREIAASLAPWIAVGRNAPPLARGTAAEPALAEALWLAAASVCAGLYLGIDVLMLQHLRGGEEVAAYGLATRIIGPGIIAVGLLAAPILPLLARAGRERAATIIGHAVALLLGIVLAGSLAFVASADVVRWVAGRPVDVAAASLLWLAPVPAAVVVGTLASGALIAFGKSRRWLVVAAGGLALNVGLNALWIPDAGAVGAARATLVTESVVGVAALMAIDLRAPRGFAGRAFAFGVACAIAPAVAALLAALLVGRVLGDPSRVLVLAGPLAGLGFAISPPAARLRRRIEHD